ncbi:hypothetical protein QQF64_031474, partial [Cirrhinus molitorella]
MKQKEAEAEERRKELIKKRQTAVMTLKASFAATQEQIRVQEGGGAEAEQGDGWRARFLRKGTKAEPVEQEGKADQEAKVEQRAKAEPMEQ